MIDTEPIDTRSHAQLVFAEVGGAVPLAEGLTIGRGEGCTLRLPDTAASKLHARIVRSGDSYAIVDEASTNGTWVNGTRVQAAVLSDGDEVRLGRTGLRFKAPGATARAALREGSGSGGADPGAPARGSFARGVGCRLILALDGIRSLASEIPTLDGERAVTRAVTTALLHLLRADRVAVAIARNGEQLDLGHVHARDGLDPTITLAPIGAAALERCAHLRRTWAEPVERGGSALVLPLVGNGALMGVMQAERLDPGAARFDEVDVLAADVVGTVAGGAIRTARLYQLARGRLSRTAMAVGPAGHHV